MSSEKELRKVAEKVAIDATATERGRCLWCLDQILQGLEFKVKSKILTNIQVEAAEMKLKIARALSMEVRRAIISGARPSAAKGRAVMGDPGAAGFSPTDSKCDDA